MVCKDLGYQVTTTTKTEIAKITKNVRDYTLGAALILGADPDRYSSMIRGLKNASLAGRDEWPKNVTEANGKETILATEAPVTMKEQPSQMPLVNHNRGMPR
jgi:hypothetical protein